MPRPTLRRSASTPLVRPRAYSNPYPSVSPFTRSFAPAILSTVSALSSAGASSTVAPSTPPASISVRARRVNSTSSSYSSSASSSVSSSTSSSYLDSRRVLADITWYYDGQLQAAPSILSPTATDAAPPSPFAEDDTTTTDAIIHEEDEAEELLLLDDIESDADMLAPLRTGTPEPPEAVFSFAMMGLALDGGDFSASDSAPSSVDSSPARRPRIPTRSLSLGVMRASSDLGLGLPLAAALDGALAFSRHARREASFGSESTCSEFEDIVPSPTFL